MRFSEKSCKVLKTVFLQCTNLRQLLFVSNNTKNLITVFNVNLLNIFGVCYIKVTNAYALSKLLKGVFNIVCFCKQYTFIAIATQQ